MFGTSRSAGVGASALLVFALVVGVALAGCGSNKPGYCGDRTNLENSVKALPSAVTGGVDALKTQVSTIKTQATTLVNSAKQDFPSETSVITTSLNSLQSAVAALPAHPTVSDLATIGVNAANVVKAVNSFMSATNSKCS